MLAGGLLLLGYFSQLPGYAAWRRDGLQGLSQGGRSFCYLVASDPSDPSARALSFLARLGGPGQGLVLFQTTWSRQGELERCTVREEEPLSRAYLAFCREERGLERERGFVFPSSQPPPRLQADLRAVEERGLAGCSGLGPGLGRTRRSASPALHTPTRGGWLLRDRREGARRSRRGWTMPGTIWCGAGDSAGNFTDLGIFDRTDICCREHDHCKHKLSAFEYNYGMRNFRLHTISHCDCDSRFKKCLLTVNDTIATLVGLTFFSLLQVPCFILEPVEHCAKKTWWNRCSVTELVPQAILHPQSKYDYMRPILDEFQMELWSKPTGSPSATGRENQMATSLSIDNSLKTRAGMMPTVVTSSTDFNPDFERNLMENSLPVALGGKAGSGSLLQINASNSLMSEVSGTMTIGLDKNVSEEGGFTMLGEPSTLTSLSKSVDPTMSLSKNVTVMLLGLENSTYMVKNGVESSFSIPPGEKFNLSSSSKNRSSESVPNHVGKKGLLPVDPACVSGNWSQSGIIGSCSSLPQSLDPIRHHRTRDKDKSRSCNCYKPLDRCEYKISPQEFKFSYYNWEPKTLYHCDCTKRLAKRMKRRVNVNTVEELLSEFVSLRCFRLKSVTGNCSEEAHRLCEKQSSSTVAILSKPKHLRKILKVRRTVDESLYPLPNEHKRNQNGTFIGTSSVFKACPSCQYLMEHPYVDYPIKMSPTTDLHAHVIYNCCKSVINSIGFQREW